MMDNFPDPNDTDKPADGVDTDTTEDVSQDDHTTDYEPSAETHDIDEQMEQFGLKKDEYPDIEHLEKTPESNEDQ